MAHEIEENYAFFASSKPAWHGIGHVLKDAPSIDEAWKLAYPFELFKLPVSASIDDADGNSQYLPLENHRAIVRSDGKHLGMVGKGFHLEQPYNVFNDFRPLLESGLVELEAGGTLREGSRMWGLAKIKGSEQAVIGDDVVKAYLLFATGFDGSLSRICTQTNARVVCANTLAAAQSEGVQYRIKHTSNFVEKLSSAKTEIERALKAHAESMEVYKAVAARPANEAKLKAYVRTVIVGPEVPEEKVSDPMQRKLQTVEELLETQRGLELVPAMRGTMWQGYNAVSEYLTHDAGRNADNRTNSVWFGDAAKVNKQALALALTF
jgi:phage/plasmid-like protein (TIGR03299 family)